MKELKHINQMGVKTISDLEIEIISRLKNLDKKLLKNISDREILKMYQGTTLYASIALSIAFGKFGTSINCAIKQDVKKIKKWWEFW